MPYKLRICTTRKPLVAATSKSWRCKRSAAASSQYSTPALLHTVVSVAAYGFIAPVYEACGTQIYQSLSPTLANAHTD